MRNSEYWALRDTLDRAAEDELLERIAALLEEGYLDTQQKIYAFYGEFAEENSITYEEATRLLEPLELKDCADRIKRLKELVDDIDGNNPFSASTRAHIKREIKLLQGRGRITRLQRLCDAINEKWIDITTQIDREVGNLLRQTYDREYHESLQEAGVSKTVIPVKQIEASILIPVFGNNFSDNIWRNKDNLLAFINTELKKGLVTGRDVRKTAKLLQQQEQVTYYQASRLVRTENCAARTAGTLEGYRQSRAISAVEILVAGDERMCPGCGSRAGVVVALSQAVLGDNVPPFHPNCRCTITPVITNDTDE